MSSFLEKYVLNQLIVTSCKMNILLLRLWTVFWISYAHQYFYYFCYFYLVPCSELNWIPVKTYVIHSSYCASDIHRPYRRQVQWTSTLPINGRVRGVTLLERNIYVVVAKSSVISVFDDCLKSSAHRRRPLRVRGLKVHCQIRQ